MISDDSVESRAKSRDEDFGKEEHILKSKDFNAVYKKGRAFKGEGLALYIFTNNLSHNRIGFSIGARNIKRAARRNRIRRLLREAYRLTKKDLRRGFDMIIVVKRDPAKITSYNEAKTVFLRFAKDARLLI